MSCPTCPQCPKPMAAASNGIFQKDKPLDFAVPLFIVQVVFVLALTRGLAVLLKPLRQPRVIAEMLGGILLGPSAFGRNKSYLNHIFPKKSIPVLDTFANIGLLFFLFMVGMELDLREVRKTGRAAMTIAAAGIVVPFAGGVAISCLMSHTINKGTRLAPFLVFMGVAMSITAFPVLARILAERKLLTTDVGRMAMSAAVVNDVVAWILLALAVALSGSGNNVSPAIAVWVLLSAAAFVIFMFVVVKPCLEWVVKRNPENEPVREIYICMTIAAVLAAGFITDLIGIHAIFGAFIFGLIVPKDGPFAGAMIEKLEDVVSTLMLPLYFASSGLKTNIGTVHGAQGGGILVAVVCVACGGKILATVFASMLNRIEVRKALALGVLMNTKGLVELIVLNIGRDRGVLTDEIFAIMVLMALFTTFMTSPLIMTIYKPARNQVPYTQRTLASDKENRELRLLACIRGLKHVPAMINFTEATRGTRKRPIRLYVLHMMQMSERSSAILLVQRARKDGIPYFPGGQSSDRNKDQVTFAFEAYAQLSKVTVRPMTAISGFEDMHEDICTTASDKRITLLIVPFHKQIGHDGLLDQGKAGFRSVNQRILQHAPCSVAVVVNRGLGGNAQLSPSSVEHNILVLFFGGPDDREALTLACRMVEHPGVRLSVFRFFLDVEPEHVVERMPEDPSPSNYTAFSGISSRKNLDGSEEDSEPSDTPGSPPRSVTIGGSTRSATPASPRSGILSSPVHSMMAGSPSQNQYIFHTLGIDQEEQRMMDEECIHYATNVLEARPFNGTDGMTYAEVRTTDAIDSALEYAKSEKYDLILVGRSRIPTLLVARCNQPAREFAELGPIGDALTSELQGVPTEASVIVMQQYDPSLVHL